MVIILPFFHICYRLNAPAKFTQLPNGKIYLMLMDADLFSITTKISSIIYIVATCLEGGFTLLSIIKYFSLGYTAQSKIKFTEVRLLCKFILLNLFRLRMGNEISFTILGMSNICFRVGSTATEPKTARPGLG